MGEFDDRIKELESEIKRLKDEKLALEILDLERENAAMLHENLCTKNHVDECMWFHEIKDGVVNWEDPVHKSWFLRAERLIHTGYHITDVLKIKDIVGLKIEDIDIDNNTEKIEK